MTESQNTLWAVSLKFRNISGVDRVWIYPTDLVVQGTQKSNYPGFTPGHWTKMWTIIRFLKDMEMEPGVSVRPLLTSGCHSPTPSCSCSQIMQPNWKNTGQCKSWRALLNLASWSEAVSWSHLECQLAPGHGCLGLQADGRSHSYSWRGQGSTSGGLGSFFHKYFSFLSTMKGCKRLFVF